MKRTDETRAFVSQPHAALLPFLLSMCLALPATLTAETVYYRLTFDHLSPHARGFEESGKAFWFRRDGGGAALTTRYDVLRQSQALVLRTSPTPQGADSDRAEIQIHSGITWNRDWEASLKFYLPSKLQGPNSTENHVADWQILLQCVQAKTSLPPPLSIDLEPDGRISLVARSERDRHEILWSAPLRRDLWRNLSLMFRMGDQGRVRLFLDGEQVFKRNLPLGWEGGEERWVLKTGIYRAAASTPFEVRLDDVALADGYSAPLSLR